MDREGFRHDGVNLAHANQLLRVDFDALTGSHVVIYGQTEVQKDLYKALDNDGVLLVDEAQGVELHDVEGSPSVSFEKDGIRHAIICEAVVGCDGAHGVSSEAIPLDRRVTFERNYPFVWVGILSRTPPVRDELIYANHENGFALCSMRNQNLSRYYVQGSIEDTVDDWSDNRFWEELAIRLPESVVPDLVTGPSIEKSVTPLRSRVTEPMSHGRLYLAGDAAHIVPPTGAKGLNLAISDVVYLHEALVDFFDNGSGVGLDEYSSRALARVWRAVRFSWWMTTIMHRFPGMADDFEGRLQQSELDYLFGSETAQRVLAENYVGLPL